MKKKIVMMWMISSNNFVQVDPSGLEENESNLWMLEIVSYLTLALMKNVHG